MSILFLHQNSKWRAQKTSVSKIHHLLSQIHVVIIVSILLRTIFYNFSDENVTKNITFFLLVIILAELCREISVFKISEGIDGVWFFAAHLSALRASQNSLLSENSEKNSDNLKSRLTLKSETKVYLSFYRKITFLVGYLDHSKALLSLRHHEVFWILFYKNLWIYYRPSVVRYFVDNICLYNKVYFDHVWLSCNYKLRNVFCRLAEGLLGGPRLLG